MKKTFICCQRKMNTFFWHCDFVIFILTSIWFSLIIVATPLCMPVLLNALNQKKTMGLKGSLKTHLIHMIFQFIIKGNSVCFLRFERISFNCFVFFLKIDLFLPRITNPYQKCIRWFKVLVFDLEFRMKIQKFFHLICFHL